MTNHSLLLGDNQSVRPAKILKTHFGGHGMLMQSYPTRSIRYRVLKYIMADDNLDLTFQGHFQGQKAKK